MNLLEAKRKVKFSPDLKKVLTIYPSAIRSTNWTEIARLGNAGKVAEAKALAKQDESKPSVRRHNVMARRLRMERVELFVRINQGEKQLRSILGDFTKAVTAKVKAKGSALSGLKPITGTLHDETVILRRRLNVWFNALIRDAAKMGFRHAGDALLPIFKDNREAVTEIISEQALFEAKLSFGLDSTFAKQANPQVKTSSGKWAATSARIIRNITKTNLQGLTPSERIWDLTSRTEADLKRIISNQIAAGESPYNIAKDIESYVSPDVSATDALGVSSGPGVYRSPYRNAMRIARTETNRTYTQSTAAFAKGKPWIQGIQVTLSPNHDVEDECDDLAAQPPMTPDEFADALPVHSHCGCGGTYVIDPAYLGEDDNANDSGDDDASDDTKVGGTD